MAEMSGPFGEYHETEFDTTTDFAQLMKQSEAAWANDGDIQNLLVEPEPLRLDDRYCPLHPGADE